MTDLDADTERSPEQKANSNFKRIMTGMAVAGVIMFVFKDSMLAYIGVAVALITVLDFWKLGQFHIGRLVAVLIVLAGVTCDYADRQAEVKVEDVRVPQHVEHVNLNIDGVAPPMTHEEIEARLGPGREDGDNLIYHDEIRVFYLDSGEADSVTGPRLFNGDKLFLKEGQTLKKLLTVLPHSRLTGRVTRVDYYGYSPDLEVLVENNVLTGFTLKKE